VVGKGFSLEAGGEVTYDTRRGLPDYGDTRSKGPFFLDGVTLEWRGEVRSGLYWYTPEKESGFERILHYTSPADYWEVTDKRGTVRIYGRRNAEGSYGNSWTGPDAYTGKKYRWLLESVEDRFGNRIRYEYETDEGEIYLSDIWYTETGSSKDGPYRIHFEYNETARKDVPVNGRGKFIAELRWRLERIELLYHKTPGSAGERIRSYRVDYLDDTSKKARRLFGVTRVVKFGEEKSDHGDYLWAYEFEYQDFEKNKEGEYILYDTVEEWNINGPIQEKSGTSSGGSAVVSGGVGIGTKIIDGRVVFAGTVSANSGDTDTDWTLADIDGDGRPDRVRISGNDVLFYKNNGKDGFEEKSTRWTFSGDGPGKVGKEHQSSNNIGYSIYGGLSASMFSAGVTYGYTNQKSWSNEEIGFADINGDGLIDIVIKGEDYYWQNRGSEEKRFKLVYYGWGGKDGEQPVDLEPELSPDEIKEYDEAYYQQAPLRQWRIPYDGTVEVTQEVKKAYPGIPLTKYGVKTYLYVGGKEENPFTYHLNEA
jgi:hypothetical protein